MLTVLKKIALGLLILLIVAQIPFCWRRFQLARVNERVKDLNNNRIETTNAGFRHYKGVIHVHTNLGGHSAGDFDELIRAAQSNELNFVILTEHPSPLYDTARQTLNGTFSNVLFVGGNEISSKTGDRFLILPGASDANKDSTKNTQELLDWAKQNSSLVLITYPEKYNAWNTAKDFDGLEVYSLYTNAKQFPYLTTFFDYFWSFGAFPELTIARNFKRPDNNLQKFDELTAENKSLILFGASDAHSNIGLQLTDRAKHTFFKLQIDSYEIIFRLVRLHVWLPENQQLNTENLLTAIKNGNCYIAFDVYGNADGFSFGAENAAERKQMGDEIELKSGVRLSAFAPIRCRFAVFRDGAKIAEVADANEIRFDATEKGAYRVELYLDSLELNRAPWIISNPIYLR
jgi:hypothetical protein